MPIKQDRSTGKWKIGENGTPRYFTEQSARNAYANHLKRGGTPVASATAPVPGTSPQQEPDNL